MKIIETGPDRYQPDPKYVYATDPKIRVDQRRLALIVGLIALGLPAAMLLGTVLGACFYDSISHYYYAQFWGDVFVGSLIFIGTFMIAYRGGNPSESRIATFAGICAIVVAAIPTSGRGCPLEEFQGRALADFERLNQAEFVTVIPATSENSHFELFTNASTYHFIAAAILFAVLAYYSFIVFTRMKPDQYNEVREPSAVKKNRNRIYVISGSLIVLSMVALGLNAILMFSFWNDLNLTFWFEALALWAFGFSWMVKGRWFFGLNLMDKEDEQDQVLSGGE